MITIDAVSLLCRRKSLDMLIRQYAWLRRPLCMPTEDGWRPVLLVRIRRKMRSFKPTALRARLYNAYKVRRRLNGNKH